MIDPTPPADLGPPIGWTDTDTDPAFAAGAARYLRDQGLGSEAIVVALRTELGLPASEAVRLAAGPDNARLFCGNANNKMRRLDPHTGGELNPAHEEHHATTQRPHRHRL